MRRDVLPTPRQHLKPARYGRRPIQRRPSRSHSSGPATLPFQTRAFPKQTAAAVGSSPPPMLRRVQPVLQPTRCSPASKPPASRQHLHACCRALVVLRCRQTPAKDMYAPKHPRRCLLRGLVFSSRALPPICMHYYLEQLVPPGALSDDPRPRTSHSHVDEGPALLLTALTSQADRHAMRPTSPAALSCSSLHVSTTPAQQHKQNNQLAERATRPRRRRS